MAWYLLRDSCSSFLASLSVASEAFKYSSTLIVHVLVMEGKATGILFQQMLGHGTLVNHDLARFVQAALVVPDYVL
jgi:hypothetical protein